jgi:hypothetical protein
VLEIAPPRVRTDLMNIREAEGAMPLDQFVAETMAKLATDADEILVELSPFPPPVMPSTHVSNAKMRLQSFFMLITIQARDFASSISVWLNVPTLVSGKPPAGP